MLLATSAAFSKTLGLLITFVGIGIVVNAFVIYIAVQIYGERKANRRYLAAQLRPPDQD